MDQTAQEKPNGKTTIWRYSNGAHAAGLLPLFLFGAFPFVIALLAVDIIDFSFVMATPEFRALPGYTWIGLAGILLITAVSVLAFLALGQSIQSMKLAFVRAGDGSLYVVDYKLLTLKKSASGDGTHALYKGGRQASAANPAMVAYQVVHDERVLLAGAAMNTTNLIVDDMRTYRSMKWMNQNQVLEKYAAAGKVDLLGNRIVSVQSVKRKLFDYRVSCVVATRQGKTYARTCIIARWFKNSADIAGALSSLVKVKTKVFYR